MTDCNQSSSDMELSIIMPVKDEGVNLGIMLRLLTAGVEVTHEVLVVYDYPEDDSVPVVRSIQQKYPNLRLIYNQRGRGVVNAIIEGVQAAAGKYILIACADEVGPVIAIDDMVQLLREGCDFVSGTRYLYGGRRLGGSTIGAIFSRVANFLFFNAGSAFSDATTGLKLFRRDCFSRLNLVSRPVGWVVAFEMAIKAQLAGLKLGEVPVISVDRLYGGQSSFQLGPWFIEYFKWFCWGVWKLRQCKSTPDQKIMVRVPTTTIGYAKAKPAQ